MVAETTGDRDGDGDGDGDAATKMTMVQKSRAFFCTGNITVCVCPGVCLSLCNRVCDITCVCVIAHVCVV